MKDNLPYFSHDNNSRRHPKMKALIAEFGYEGYGRFWALNERIAETPSTYIDISRKVNKLDLANELGLDGDGLDKFLKFLSDPEIDLININDNKISTDRITELFSRVSEEREYERDKKRKKKGKEEIPEGKDNFPEGNKNFPDEFPKEKDTDKIRSDKIRSNKTRLDKTKQENILPKQKPFELLSREPKNDLERVNKKWLENYISLHGEQPINPSWSISAPLVSKAIKQVGVDKILQALDTAMRDEFCIKSGYILKTIMATNIISKLVNKPPGSKHHIATDNISPDKASKYFRNG